MEYHLYDLNHNYIGALQVPPHIHYPVAIMWCFRLFGYDDEKNCYYECPYVAVPKETVLINA